MAVATTAYRLTREGLRTWATSIVTAMYGGIGRLIAVLGTLVALAGFGLFMWVIIAPMAELVVGPDAGMPANPFTREVFGLPAVAVGFGGFLAGGVIASVGAGMARAARRRHDRAQQRARGWY